MIVCGDSLEALRALPAECFDSLVTDPPAGIAFMAKEWDKDKGGRDAWIAWLASILTEARRVLKPGAHALVWTIPRTSHWTGMAIEDAGFAIRDSIAHLFGTGFPKSHNLDGEWDGFGTALKPAREDWILCRKPFKGSVAANVERYGCGALNVDGCRIPAEKLTGWQGAPGGGGTWNESNCGLGQSGAPRPADGRWPANVVLGCACEQEHEPGCAVAMLDAQSGLLMERGNVNSSPRNAYDATSFQITGGDNNGYHYDNGGGASRFFYVAKATREEREAGLRHRTRRNVNDGRDTSIDNPYQRGDTQRANTHPTVKSVALMRWLTRLVTPPGGHVLDAFAGSGTTGMACAYEGFRFTGIELDPEHCEIARARIAQAREDAGRLTPEEAQAKAEETGSAVQLGIFGDEGS